MVHDFTVHTGLGHVWSSKIQGEIVISVEASELSNASLKICYYWIMKTYLIISAENVIPFQFLKSEFKNLI